MTKAYLLGALHDATIRKNTIRISQKSKEYTNFIANGIKSIGSSAWTYKEGKNREVYIVEFSKSLLENVKLQTNENLSDYLRGYFDTDGGIAKQSQVRYYIYYAQKDFYDLILAKKMLEKLGIVCGKIHNPSKKVDPSYWRFYISAKSHFDFAQRIGSWHPQKKSYLRMMI